MNGIYLHNPIDIQVIFYKDKLKPLKFRWNNKNYIIKEINGHWIKKQKSYSIIYYSIQVNNYNGIYIISFYTKDLKWYIEEIWNL